MSKEMNSGNVLNVVNGNLNLSTIKIKGVGIILKDNAKNVIAVQIYKLATKKLQDSIIENLCADLGKLILKHIGGVKGFILLNERGIKKLRHVEYLTLMSDQGGLLSLPTVPNAIGFVKLQHIIQIIQNRLKSAGYVMSVTETSKVWRVQFDVEGK